MTRSQELSGCLTGLLGLAATGALTAGLLHACSPTTAPHGPHGTVTRTYTRTLCGQHGCHDVGSILVRHNGGQALITATTAQADACQPHDTYPTCLEGK